MFPRRLCFSPAPLYQMALRTPDKGNMADLLFDSPDNPLPANAQAGTFGTRDGKHIRYALFGATGRPMRGTVILLQGRNECIEKYFETIGDLQEAGLGVATFDWRGQGGSERLLGNPRRGHVRRFADYVADLEQFYQDIVLPDCRLPLFVLAHSTGALVALLAAASLINQVQRMVLSAPLFVISGLPFSMRTARRLTGFLRSVGAGGMRLGGRRGDEPPAFEGNVLTSDAGRFRRNAGIYERHPELALGSPSIAWVNAACKAAATVTDSEFLADIRIPALFVVAGADKVVSTRAIEDCARRMRSASLLTIDGARHEILQEADLYREQMLAATKAFMLGEVANGD
jgi:lysophospholipase